MTKNQKAVKNIKTKTFRNNQYDKGLCKVCLEPRLFDLKTCKKHYLEELSYKHLGTTKRWEDLLNLLEQQNYICAYTGEELILGLNAGIDHKLPLSKYPELINDINNLQWTLKDINIMKSNFPEEEFLKFVYKIFYYKIKKGEVAE